MERRNDGVARLHGLEGRGTLNTTDFTDDDVARTTSKSGFEKVEHLDTRIFVLCISSDEALPDLVANFDFRRVFCRVNLHVVIDERKDSVERRRLPRCRFPRHEDGHAVFQTNPDVRRLLSRHRAPFDELNHRNGLLSELTDGERGSEHGDVVGENDVDT